MRRWLAGQFAQPHGLAGRYLIGPWLDRIAAPMNRLALRQLRVAPANRVVEIGFGGGGLLRMLLSAGAEQVIGIDVSSTMLARAKSRFASELAGGRLLILPGSAERLPLPDASVDRAVSLNSLYFWPDLPGAVGEIARVLRLGGRLVVGFEPPEELRKWPGHRFGFQMIEQSRLETLLHAAGFGEIDVVEGRGRKPDRFLCLSAKRLDANG